MANGLEDKSMLLKSSIPTMIDSACEEAMLVSTILLIMRRVSRTLKGDTPGVIRLRMSYTKPKLSVHISVIGISAPSEVVIVRWISTKLSSPFL